MSDQKPARRGNPRWVRGGASPNPGGRPPGKSLARAIAEQTTADEIAEYAVRVLRDEGAKPEHRQWAAAWLADRLEGKAVSVVDMQATVSAERPALPGNWRELSRAEREQWLRVHMPHALPAGGG